MKMFGYKKTKKGKALRIISLVVVILLALGAGVLATYDLFITPPEIKTTDPPVSPSVTADALSNEEEDENEGALDVSNTGRVDGMYTFLVAGEDEEAGGTDVIMVGRLDTNSGDLNVISIPRDTMVNVPWSTRKVNSYKNMYTLLEEEYDNYIPALIDGVEKLIGFQVDSYVVLNLQGFVALIDAVGGVEFDVPQSMKYSDPIQGLEINLEAGMQQLDGQQAMQLVRYRHYTFGDLDRISVQHEFMNALVDKLLSASTIFAIDDLVKIFEENVQTDMSYSNLLWYAKQCVGLDSDSINFYTAENTIKDLELSYVTLNVEEWLEQVNTYINPYTSEITLENVDIISQTAAGKLYYTTDELDKTTLSTKTSG